MVILLTMKESESSIIAGFPEYLELETNVPSTVFYTLDGTEPDITSAMYVDRVVMPTAGTTVVFKAKAVAGSSESGVLERGYFTELDFDYRRDVKEGVVTLPFGVPIVDSLAVGLDGSKRRATAIEFIELELEGSTIDRFGNDIPMDTTLEFVNFEIKSHKTDEAIVSSPNGNVNFDPKSQLIIVNNVTEEDKNNQVVRVMGRVTGALDPISKEVNRNRHLFALNTCNFTGYERNPYTGITTFYYHDSRDNRSLRITEKIEAKRLNISNNTTPVSSFVFRWVEHRAQTGVF